MSIATDIAILAVVIIEVTELSAPDSRTGTKVSARLTPAPPKLDRGRGFPNERPRRTPALATQGSRLLSSRLRNRSRP